jgi:hypothetical protein
MLNEEKHLYRNSSNGAVEMLLFVQHNRSKAATTFFILFRILLSGIFVIPAPPACSPRPAAILPRTPAN